MLVLNFFSFYRPLYLWNGSKYRGKFYLLVQTIKFRPKLAALFARFTEFLQSFLRDISGKSLSYRFTRMTSIITASNTVEDVTSGCSNTASRRGDGCARASYVHPCVRTCHTHTHAGVAGKRRTCHAVAQVRTYLHTKLRFVESRLLTLPSSPTRERASRAVQAVRSSVRGQLIFSSRSVERNWSNLAGTR